MSILKKGIRAIGKVVKGAVKFVKEHWKLIVLVGLTVFSMGIASAGWGAFMESIGTFGGGFGGFMSAVGSTMYGGITALGGTLGLTSGAAGTVAGAGHVTGTGLFGGHLAAALGSKAAAAGIASKTALSGISPLASSVGLGVKGSALAINPVTGAAIGKSLPAAFEPVVAPAAGSGLAQAAAITTAGNMISGFGAAQMNKPPKARGFWGVDVQNRNDRSGDIAFDPNASQAMFTPPAPAAPAVPAPPAIPAGGGTPVTNAPLTPQQLYQLQQLRQMGLMNLPWAAQGA